jgi:hypothetical protein
MKDARTVWRYVEFAFVPVDQLMRCFPGSCLFEVTCFALPHGRVSLRRVGEPGLLRVALLIYKGFMNGGSRTKQFNQTKKQNTWRLQMENPLAV